MMEHFAISFERCDTITCDIPRPIYFPIGREDKGIQIVCDSLFFRSDSSDSKWTEQNEQEEE
ncbi:hypothetical protein [uncultured Bacteroides sp.]|uniref:hypothetical protein n=1 Tax=uncultured Bacteroides sp. TaxID=162156 RepID=UPI0025952192|nr:hypothetical protein [uncultured Bacteroides sp.]